MKCSNSMMMWGLRRGHVWYHFQDKIKLDNFIHQVDPVIVYAR